MKNCAYKLNDGVLTVENSVFSRSFENIVSAKGADVKPRSRSMPYFEVNAERGDGSVVSYRVFDDIPVVRVSDDSESNIFSLYGDHWSVRTIKLNAFTDECDTLVDETLYELFFKGLHKTLVGDIFIFENAISEKAYLLISETPDHVRGQMELKRRNPEDIFKVGKKPFIVTVKNGGYPVAIGECKKGECEALARAYFRHEFAHRS